MQKNLADLHSVFVPFETVKFEGGTVIYMNECIDCELNRSQLLEKYSYIVPNNEGDNPPDKEKKTFLAERYGGDGMLTNGGGARCGFDGRYQLKGLGANRLVGKRPPDARGNSHANGFLSLDIAIYESIWAEIVNIALPYGAVRTVAIIDLGIDFEESNAPHARALLVRMPAVRPAHFIRATFFKEKKIAALSPDAERVKAVIQTLNLYLPNEKVGQPYDNHDEQLSDGIVELARRFAKQFAASKSSRIFHANVSASNLTLDGAWMDLAGTKIFSDRCWWDGFDESTFFEEFTPAISSINELCYYLYKYQVVSIGTANHIAARALECFTSEYEKQLSLYNAVQAGFPLNILESLTHNPIFLDFSTQLKTILSLDKFSMTPICTKSGWRGYEHWISRVYIQLLKHKQRNIPQDFSWISKDEQLINKLTSTYDILFELILADAKSKGVSPECFEKCIALNSTRLNRCSALLTELYDEVVNTREKSCKTQDISLYETLFKNAKNDATQSFNIDCGYYLRIWKNLNATIYYDATLNLYTAEFEDNNPSITGTLRELTQHNNVPNDFISFYDGILE